MTRVARLLLALWCLVVLLLVAWPDPWAINRLVVRIYVVFLERGVPPSFGPDEWAVLLNALMLVPLVVLGALAYPASRLRWWVLGCAALSVLVELGQLLVGSRDPSLGDVAANVAGALVGAAIALLLRRRRGRVGDSPGGAAPI